MKVDVRPYGKQLSSIFGAPSRMATHALDDDRDPIISELRVLNYRYVPFYFHPIQDKFILSSGWKDPQWTDVFSVRAGIDSDEKQRRDLVFGHNLIDIEQKSTFRLLVDEVSLSRKDCNTFKYKC